MNYIYDIVLNFNKEYFEFFEWKKTDKIINVKKIPVFRVCDKDMQILKYNKVKLSQDFLEKIYNLTLFYSKMDNYKYSCLVSNTVETIGLMFDKEGNLIKISSLIFDEEDEVNDEVTNEEEFKFNYIENNNVEIEYLSRMDKEKRDYLIKFINKLDVIKDESILKYLFYDYFEKEEDDCSKIKKILLKEINNNNSNKNKLCDLVKVFRKIKN